MKILNFGRNLTLRPTSIYTPHDEREVIDLLKQNRGKRIRCVGRLHSWSRVLPCDDILLDLRELNQVRPAIDHDRRVAYVGAGCQIKMLLDELGKRNLTLPSVGFITEQTIAGAISTGTHGSGRHSLSHYVTGVRIARYDKMSGQVVVDEISDGDALRAARCSLGCMGVILGVTIQCRPRYNVEEHFREHQRISQVMESEKDFPLQQFYLVPWRWSYVVQHRRETDSRVSPGFRLYKWYRFITFDIAMHLSILFSARVIRFHWLIKMLFGWIIPVLVIRDWRVVGESSEQLVMEHEMFRHLEIELFVQRGRLPESLEFLQQVLCATENANMKLAAKFRVQLEQADCVDALAELRGVYCHHYPICIRRILSDDTLISMACESDSSDEPWYSITLTNYHRGQDRDAFESLASLLATSMAELFGARLHWGKLCPLADHQVCELYPAFDRFREICREYDPDTVFSNAWTRSLLASTSPASAVPFGVDSE